MAVPTQAPDFELEHIAGHDVSLADYRGQNVVVLFGGRDSADQVKQIVTTIRASRDSDELPVLAISDLGAVPRPARILAKTQLKKAYQEAVEDATGRLRAAGKPDPEDPAKEVVMLLDWKGEVVEAYGQTGVDKEASAVLVGGDGQVLGSASGAQAGDEILGMLPS